MTKTIPSVDRVDAWSHLVIKAKRSKGIRCLRLEMSLNNCFRPGLMRSVFVQEMRVFPP